MMTRYLTVACVFATSLIVGHCLILQDAAPSDHGEILRLNSVVNGLLNLTDAIQKEVASKNDLTQFLQADVIKLNQTLQFEMQQRAVLERRVRDLESKLRTLTGTSGENGDDITDLQMQMGNLKLQLSTTTSQNSQLNQTIQNQLSTLTTNLTSLAQTLSAPKTENHLHFTVKGPAAGIPTPNQPLVFTSVVSASAVNHITNGVFTAPWKGVYWFGVTLSATTSDYVQCFLVHNGVEYLADIFTSEAGESTVSVHVTTSLNVNDHVQVSQCNGSGNIDPYKTTFSGIFLNPE